MKATPAVYVAVFVASVSAADAKVVANKPLLVSNGITINALGNFTFDDVSAILTMPIPTDLSQLPVNVKFGARDGFIAEGGSGFTAYGLSFVDIGFNNQGILKGTLLGSGSMSLLSFSGDQLIVNALSNTSDGLLATNFSLSPSLRTYLTNNNADPLLFNVLGSIFKSISVYSSG